MTERKFKVGDRVVIIKGRNKGYAYEVTELLEYAPDMIFYRGVDVPGGGWRGHSLELEEVYNSPLYKALE